MIKMTNTTQELEQIYTFNNSPSYDFEYARNLGYKHGVSTWNDDYFNPYLNKLINSGILTKNYDFVKEGYREALYSFPNGNQIELFGENHMEMRLFYNY